MYRVTVRYVRFRCNKWPSVIYSRWGNWPQPYEAGKCAVLAPSELVSG